MKNANFMAPIKAFFSKAWTATKAFSIKAGKWIVANKLISIPVAVVLVGGIACAIALPIALHEHDFATEWSSDANNHWHSAICSHEEEKSDLGAHVYDNDCDTTCNTCGATRTVGAHVYDNDCDTTCNNCGATRTVGAHVYDNACDTTCNTCGATRAITHDHADTLTAGDTTHYYLCSVCGDKKDEVAHVFDKTVASSEYLKAEATATTKAQYYKSCVCGKASATEYFETDKTTGTLANIQDLSKTYDKVELANPTYETNSDGAVTIEWYQGDTKLDSKPVNVGTYKVKVIIAESATYTGISAEKEFTIAKKVLSNVKASVIYDGSTTFGEITLAHDGIVAGDVIIADIDVANKNVGVYTGTGAVFTILYGLGNGAANYEIDATTCKVTVTPKTLNYLELTKVYNGKRGFGENAGIYCQLDVENGVIAGDTVFLETSDDIEYNVGTYTFTRANSGETNDTVWLYGADAGNYDFQGDANDYAYVVGEITVTPKTINVTAEFEYSGISVRQIHAPAPSLSDVIDGDEVYIEIAFDKADVDATVLTGEDAPYLDGADCDNYTLGTYSFSIVPKKLTLKAGETIEVTETYYGKKQYTLSVSSNMFDGYVDAEAASLWLTATAPSKNVGEYTNGVILTPYVGNSAFGTVSHNYDFSEVAAKVTIKPLTVSLSSYVKVEYNGTSEFTLATPFDLTSANTGGGQDSVLDNDEVYITWIETSDADITDETFAIDYTLGGADAGNYDIDELGVEITKKKLTNLHLYITSDTYESGEITLIAKDGVVAGEVVKISITNVNDQDFWEGFSIFMELEDGTSPDAYRYETIALVPSGDSANYELATYDDGSGYQVVGIVEGVASCDVQYDGSCNCGTSHLIGTAASSVTRTTLPCATTWTGGVYKISTLPGYWSILPSDNFADITAIYDANGNEVEIDANDAGFYAEAGTYYVHIGKASDLGSAKHITFTYTNTLANLDGAAAKSELITAKSGDAIFFRIEDDAPWGASMNVYSDNETTLLDSSKYTVTVYDEYFKELTGVIYDGTDVYHATDDNYSVTDKTIYIEVLLSADTNVQIYIY